MCVCVCGVDGGGCAFANACSNVSSALCEPGVKYFRVSSRQAKNFKLYSVTTDSLHFHPSVEASQVGVGGDVRRGPARARTRVCQGARQLCVQSLCGFFSSSSLCAHE